MKFDIKYVYEQRVTPLGNKKFKKEVVGQGHMLLLLSSKTLCGIEVSKIKHVVKKDKWIDALGVCKDCQEAWKNHPQSEWRRWVGVDSSQDQTVAIHD